MSYGALERFLAPTRHRSRAAVGVGSAVPLMVEIPVERSCTHFLVTDTRGRIIPTRATKDGMVRVGMSTAPIGEETSILEQVVQDLPTRFSTWEKAVNYLATQGHQARSIVMSEADYASAFEEGVLPVSLDEAKSSMSMRGYVSVTNDVQLLLASLPKGAGLVAELPAMAGVYLRVGDFLGVLVQTNGVVAVDVMAG